MAYAHEAGLVLLIKAANGILLEFFARGK